MTPQLVMHVVSDAMLATFFICAPLLAIVFVVGIVINVIQIATSMQDQVFSTVPRLTACLGGFLFLMPWMLNRATGYALAVMRDLVKFTH